MSTKYRDIHGQEISDDKLRRASKLFWAGLSPDERPGHHWKAQFAEFKRALKDGAVSVEFLKFVADSPEPEMDA